MSEMFEIFLENFEAQINKLREKIINLQDCQIDKIQKITSDGERILEETQRIVRFLL